MRIADKVLQALKEILAISCRNLFLSSIQLQSRSAVRLKRKTSVVAFRHRNRQTLQQWEGNQEGAARR